MKHKNFSDIISYNANHYPDKTFCIEYTVTKRKVTYSEFNDYVNQCCNFLKNFGIEKDDKVSYSLENHFANSKRRGPKNMTP